MLKKEYAIKVKSYEFKKVDVLLQVNDAENIKKIEKDYYLFSFTDAELLDVIT